MKLGVFMLWTEMRDGPKGGSPLAFDRTIREHDRAAALAREPRRAPAAQGAPPGTKRAPARKKRPVIQDEITSV